MKGQNKTKIWNRTVLNITRRLFSVILTAAMVFTNVGVGLNTVYASEADAVEFTMSSSQLLDAVENAVAGNQKVTAVDMDFTNGKIQEFEDYFFGSGKLLEVFPEIEGGSMDAELRVFIRVPENADETYMVTGSEDIIFLYVNNGDDTIRCTTSISRMEDGEEKVKKTHSVTVKDFETAYGDENVNYISAPVQQPETTVPETQSPAAEETETAAPETEITAPSEDEIIAPETETSEEIETAPSEESESAAPETEETAAKTETSDAEKADTETTTTEENSEESQESEEKVQNEETDDFLEDTAPVAKVSRHETPVVAQSVLRGGGN